MDKRAQTNSFLWCNPAMSAARPARGPTDRRRVANADQRGADQKGADQKGATVVARKGARGVVQKIGDLMPAGQKDVVPKGRQKDVGQKVAIAIPAGAAIAAVRPRSFAHSVADGAVSVQASSAAVDPDAGLVFVRHLGRQVRAALAGGPAAHQAVVISTAGLPSWSAK